MKLEEAKILIGDDSILARKQLKDIISSFGGKDFIEAANGDEAVKLALSDNPDLVFLDLVMPVMDGITAVQKIRSEKPDMDIVICSSVGTQAQLKAAIEAGATDFIQKPLKESLIKVVLQKRFEGR